MLIWFSMRSCDSHTFPIFPSLTLSGSLANTSMLQCHCSRLFPPAACHLISLDHIPIPRATENRIHHINSNLGKRCASSPVTQSTRHEPEQQTTSTQARAQALVSNPRTHAVLFNGEFTPYPYKSRPFMHIRYCCATSTLVPYNRPTLVSSGDPAVYLTRG